MPGIGKMVFVANGHDEVLKRWALGCLADSLCKEGVPTKVLDLARGNHDAEIRSADVAMFYRCFDLRTFRLMRRLRMEGVFVLFFLDDYLFQPGCRYTGGWQATTAPMEEADCLVSSSAHLLSKMPDKPKILRRSVLDEAAMSVLSQEYRRGQRFSVGWIAGRGRSGAMDSFVEEFLRELNRGMEGGEGCDFRCFGTRFFPKMDKVAVKEHVWYRPEDWRGLYSGLVGFDLGVVVNPLDESDEFCKCKSELKFVESGAMGVPLVTSRVPPYIELIRDGGNGFLASGPGEFAEKVLLVMRDEKLARMVGADARDTVRTAYNARDNARQFFADVTSAMEATRKRRV